jgi:uncharacterized membrane protein
MLLHRYRWPLLILVVLATAVAAARPLRAAPVVEESPAPIVYALGRVTDIVAQTTQMVGGTSHRITTIRVVVLRGPQRTTMATARHVAPSAEAAEAPLRPGDVIVMARDAGGPASSYDVVDRYRLPALGLAALLFVGCAIGMSRVRGVTALIGLGASLLILSRFVVPRIMAGANPLAISLIAAFAVGLVSLYLAHGFNRRTSVALLGTMVTLAFATGLADLIVGLAHLSGRGSDEALFLQTGYLETVNLRGLLLGGIVLGALGVLDDITTAQAAAVEEISRADPGLGVRDLYRRGLSVGREHITSLVNTLVLAYAGASLPLFILFTLNTNQPLWVTLNSEFVAEEIARTIIGSLALTLAVPITTALAARLLRSAGTFRPTA